MRVDVSLVAACTLVAAAVSSCAGTATRSEGSFCSDLKQGESLLNGSARDAGPGLASQLGTLVRNLGRFTSLLHHLDAEAPSEISVDMHDVRDQWDSQKDTIKEEFSNPLGAFASLLVGTVFTSEATQNVDTYAQAHCGAQLFGSAVSQVGGGADAASGPSPAPSAVPSGCPSPSPDAGGTDGNTIADLFQSTGTLTELTGVLDELASSDDDTVSQQAKALEDAISSESPVPLGSEEALARLRWTSTDPDAALSALDTATAGACGSAVFGSDEVSQFTDLTPAPLGSDHSGGDSWATATCKDGHELGLVGGGRDVFSCDDGAVIVDLTTGAVTRLTGLLHEDPSLSNDAEPTLVLGGAHLLWIDVAVTKATGLAPGHFDSTLRIRDLQGGVVADVPLQTNDSDIDDEGTPNSLPKISFAGDGYIGMTGLAKDGNLDLTLTDGAGGNGIVLDGAYNDQVLDGRLLAEPVDFYDVLTRKQLEFGPSKGRENDDSYTGDGGCGLRGVITHDRGGFDDGVQNTRYALSYRKPATTISAIPVKKIDGDSLGITRAGVLVHNSAGIAMVNLAGDTVWTIGADVETDAKVTLGWVVVTNKSSQQIVVDPDTGKEAALSDELTSLLMDGKVESVDPASNTLLYQTKGVGPIQRVDFTAVCS